MPGGGDDLYGGGAENSGPFGQWWTGVTGNPQALGHVGEAQPKVPLPPIDAPIAQPGEVAPNTEFTNDMANAAQATDQFDQDITPRFNGPTGGPGVSVQDEGENYLPYGGKDAYEETFVRRPQQIEQAIKVAGETEAQFNDAKKNFFERTQAAQAEELAVMQQHRIENAAQVAAQQAKIDMATKRYTSDLADRGQFWLNPGNILAAFGAALVAAGSPGDRGIGIRTIQAAVEADYNKRKGLADMHLGELRSNLAQYRQIAGDKEQGDKLAFAESNRVAGMELERIAAQFQGPLAKAKAQEMAAQFYQKSELMKAQVHSAMVYNTARAIPTPLKQSFDKTGKATGGEGYTSYQAQNAPPVPVPGKTLPGQAPGKTASGPAVSPAVANTAKALASVPNGVIDTETKKLYDERAPGASKLAPMFRQRVAEQAVINAGPHPTVEKLRQEAQKVVRGYHTQVAEVAKEAGPAMADQKTWSALDQDLQLFERAAGGPDKVNDYFGYLQKGGAARLDNQISQLKQQFGSRGTPEEQRQIHQLEAVQRINQVIANKTVDYYHQMAGSAQSPTERGDLERVIGTSSPYAAIKNFAAIKSKEAAGKYQASTVGLDAPAMYLLQIRLGQKSVKLNTPGTK